MQRDLALVKPTRKYASQVMHYKQEMLANNDSLDGCAVSKTRILLMNGSISIID